MLLGRAWEWVYYATVCGCTWVTGEGEGWSDKKGIWGVSHSEFIWLLLCTQDSLFLWVTTNHNPVMEETYSTILYHTLRYSTIFDGSSAHFCPLLTALSTSCGISKSLISSQFNWGLKFSSCMGPQDWGSPAAFAKASTCSALCLSSPPDSMLCMLCWEWDLEISWTS